MSIAVEEPASEEPARRGRPGYGRDQVLDAAVQLFIEKGYDATSVSDVADRLGLTKSALYHHFTSKEQLLRLALDSALAALEDILDQPAAREGTPGARLEHIVRAAVRVLIEKLPSVTLLLRVRGNSPVELDAMERRRVFDDRVTAVVRAAQTHQQVRSDIDAAVATRLLFGMVNSLTEWYRPGGPVDIDEMAATVLTTALDGLRLEQAPTSPPATA